MNIQAFSSVFAMVTGGTLERCCDELIASLPEMTRMQRNSRKAAAELHLTSLGLGQHRAKRMIKLASKRKQRRWAKKKKGDTMSDISLPIHEQLRHLERVGVEGLPDYAVKTVMGLAADDLERIHKALIFWKGRAESREEARLKLAKEISQIEGG